MQNQVYHKIVGFLFLLSLVACEKALIAPIPENTPIEVFETFWQLVEENYCLFEEKQVDWQELYDLHRPQINEQTSDIILKGILEEMLAALQDGHVNLYTENGRSRYDFTEGYPLNYDRRLLYRNYLTTNPTFEQVGLLETASIDSITYIRIPSFGSFSNGNSVDVNPDILDDEFDAILAASPNTKGLIIDVRDNSGGNTGNADALLARFISTPVLAYHLRPKNGPGRNDFGEPDPFYIQPRNPQYTKPVYLLTNRASYSATNYCAAILKNLTDNVTVIGGKTGGGGGLPTFKDLPNNWLVRLSTIQLLDHNQQQIEEGIEPDIEITLTEEDIEKNKDTILEFALDQF